VGFGPEAAPLEVWARLTPGLYCLRLPVFRRTRTVVICAGDF